MDHILIGRANSADLIGDLHEHGNRRGQRAAVTDRA